MLPTLAAAACLAGVGVGWLVADAGETCTSACKKAQKSCSEDHWPTQRDGVAGVETAKCVEWVLGGFYEAPVMFGNGGEVVCAWQGPERVWNKGDWGLSGPRCDRVGHKEYNRICPCREEYRMAGVAAWGGEDVRWAIHEKESNLLAGIQDVRVMSTVRTDTYHVSRYNPAAGNNSTVTQWYEAGPDLTAATSPHWHDYNTSIYLTEANDLCTVTVTTNGSIYSRCDNYTDLPYYNTVDGAEVIYPGPGVEEIPLPINTTSAFFGGNVTSLVDELIDPNDIRALMSTRAAFAVLTESGRVMAWGDENSGGTAPPLTNALQLFATRAAFAALLDNNTVVTWGDPQYGGDVPPLSGVLTVYATQGAFAALITDMSVVAWGSPYFGGSINGIHELEEDTRTCPPTFTPPTTYQQCNASAAYLQRPDPTPISNPSLPPGCFLNETENIIYYNDNPNPVPCMWETWEGVSLRGEWFREEETLMAEECKDICCGDVRCSSTTHVKEFTNDVPSGMCRFYETEEMYTPTVTLTVTESMSPTVSLTASPKPSRTATPSFTPTASASLEIPPTPTLTVIPTATVTMTATEHSTRTMSDTSTLPTPTRTTTPTIEVVYQHNLTFTSFVKVNEISLICTADPNSVGNIVAAGVQGVVATAKSFMALTSDRVAIWPHPNDTIALETATTIDPSPNSVFASEDAFLVVDKNWQVTTHWAPGSQGGTFWTENLAPLPAQLVGKVIDIRTTRGAATVVSETGAIATWKTKPDALGQFVSLNNVACFWQAGNEGKYVIYNDQMTALECATTCLNTPGCTGFEYPVSGVYCAPWLYWECSNISSSGWHNLVWGDHNYELYLLKDHVFDAPLNASDEYYLVGKGGCMAGEDTPANISTASADPSQCKQACNTEPLCKAYDTHGTQCTLYTEESDGSSGNEGTESYCYSQTIKGSVPSGPSGLSISAIIFKDVGGAEQRIALMNETENGWSIPEGAITLMSEPIEYYLVTSSDLAEYDVVRWMLLRRVNVNLTQPVHVLNWYNYAVPASRRTRYGPFPIYLDVAGTEVFLRPLRGRGKLWFERVPNAACPDIDALPQNATTSFTLSSSSPSQCGEVCQFIKTPGNCTSYAYWQDQGMCRLYFNDDCSYPKSTTPSGWVHVPDGPELYTLSVVDQIEVADDTDYGQDAPVLTSVDFVRPSREAFTAVDNGTVVAWGGQLYGGNTSYLQVGKRKYLESGVEQVVAGVRSFSIRRTGSGHDECEITPCYAFTTDELKQPSQAGEPKVMDQICFDPNPESWSPNDFLCVCTDVAYEAVGQAVECPAPPQLAMWPWLLLALPLIGGICMRMDIIHVEKMELFRRTITLWDMYALHATGEEERALEEMLAANPGAELTLLQTLVPHTEMRWREAKMFLLTQKRFGEDAVNKLPKDLIWLVQLFMYGPERVRAPYHRPMTPFGHVISSASTVREGLSPRRSKRKGPISGEWAPELITPLVCDDESLTVTVL